MRGLVRALAALSCAVLAGCTASATPAAAPAPAPASAPTHAPARVGSPGNPLQLSCGEESFPGDPVVSWQPEPADLIVGPLFIVNGKRLATADPSGFGDHGSYKVPIGVLPRETVTVTIEPPARGQVVIDNPYSTVGGVTAATYHSCPQAGGFFAQGFAFTNGRSRGCVPLEVRVGRQPQARHVTLSLFAGSCPH